MTRRRCPGRAKRASITALGLVGAWAATAGCVADGITPAAGRTFGQERVGILDAVDATPGAAPATVAPTTTDTERFVAPPPAAVAATTSVPKSVLYASADAAPERSASSTAAAAPDAEQARREERALRDALAAASDPTEPALRLASLLVESERPTEALFVLESAAAKQRSVSLRIARAAVLRDLARNDEAARELRELLREVGAAAMSPGTMYELAELEWLAGRPEDAVAVLRDLVATHATSEWLQQNGEQVAALRDGASGGRAAGALDVRDLLALQRTAGLVSARMQLLERLARPIGEAGSEERAPVRRRAVAIGCADESAAVRARAVQLAAENGLFDAELCAATLADPASLVRRIAASTAEQALGRDAVTLLLAQLEREDDAAVFSALCTALDSTVPGPPVPQMDAATADGRERVRAAWRQRCRG